MSLFFSFFNFYILVHTRRIPSLSAHRSLLTCWGQDVWWESKGSKCLPLPHPMLLSSLPGKREGSLVRLLVAPWGVRETLGDCSQPITPAIWCPHALSQLQLLYISPFSPVKALKRQLVEKNKSSKSLHFLVKGRGFLWSWLSLLKGSLSKLTYRRRLSLDTVLCPFYRHPLNFMSLRMINTVKHVKHETFPYSSVESKSQRCLLWHKQPP